jgi:hypothetical protein
MSVFGTLDCVARMVTIERSAKDYQKPFLIQQEYFLPANDPERIGDLVENSI